MSCTGHASPRYAAGVPHSVPSPSAVAPPPLPLTRWSGDAAGVRVTRGKRRPRAIAWFGFTSFWGHLRHLVASAIATENIDSRQWMIPDAPQEILQRALEVLGVPDPHEAHTFAEALDGELWIDYVSDTGDDVTVSEAVAKLFCRRYTLENDPLGVGTLPRGNVLFLGGDLAYPVATVLEMTKRLVDPWNKVLSANDDGVTRVLLAVPGNHDWYDGLDGFARLCQAPCSFERRPPPEDAQNPAPEEYPVLAWAEAFARGEQVKKPGSLALFGYVPVQRASYFRMALAPGLELFAVDRQLKRVDPRQSSYFAVRGGPKAKLVIVPDPARAWGESRTHGVATMEALGINPSSSRTFILSGDIHHYERSTDNESLHVVAGGGGAFLHGARVAKNADYTIDSEFPGKKASREMLARLPWRLASGGAGWLVTACFLVGDACTMMAHFDGGTGPAYVSAAVVALVVAISTAFMIGFRRFPLIRVFPFSAAYGALVGGVPLAFCSLLERLSQRMTVGPIEYSLAALGATWLSGLLFGVMLLVIAHLGINHAQSYAALGHPGFKHFVRLRITSKGNVPRVDAWVIGMVDPVGHHEPVLVDAFTWPRQP